MELKIRFSKWAAGIPVAMLNLKTATSLGVHPQSMISIKTLSGKSREMSSIIDTVEDYLKNDEILVSLEIKERLNLRKGQKVDVNIAPITKSLIYIKKKLEGKRLQREEINEIVRDIVSNSLSEAEIALFVAGMSREGMTMKEIIYMIKAMVKSGNRLEIKSEFVVDKHSIGGVPGNRTTPLVVSICSAAGLIFPKTSSRAITSAAGTADTIEAVAKVDFPRSELKKILNKTNAFMVWGGGLGLVPVDSKILDVEKSLTIDPRSQMIASILSKKFAVGSRYILIDIPYGKNAKVTRKKAEKLRDDFQELGRHFRKKIRCVLTDGNEPIGNGIGPGLELRDIIKVLDPRMKGPSDLEKKALFLSGEIFEMTGKAKRGKGIDLAKKILYSGKAFEKFKQIIKAQKGNLSRLREAKFKKDIIANRSGKISEIDNRKIVSLARILGCPADKFAGIYLYLHVGDHFKKGEKIMTLYSETKTRLREAEKFYSERNPIKTK